MGNSTGQMIQALQSSGALEFIGNRVCNWNFKKILFIYLFMAALGLRCCVQAFSSCGEQWLLFIAVHRFLIAVASLVAEHGF